MPRGTLSAPNLILLTLKFLPPALKMFCSKMKVLEEKRTRIYLKKLWMASREGSDRLEIFTTPVSFVIDGGRKKSRRKVEPSLDGRSLFPI